MMTTMKTDKFKLAFVDYIPMDLMEGMLYVSMRFHTVAHLCPCGCGEKVITPLHSEHGWILTYDGKGVSLFPSIGNYEFPCNSHYFIKNSEVILLSSEMEFSRKHKRKRKGRIYSFFCKLFHLV